MYRDRAAFWAIVVGGLVFAVALTAAIIFGPKP